MNIRKELFESREMMLLSLTVAGLGFMHLLTQRMRQDPVFRAKMAVREAGTGRSVLDCMEVASHATDTLHIVVLGYHLSEVSDVEQLRQRAKLLTEKQVVSLGYYLKAVVTLTALVATVLREEDLYDVLVTYESGHVAQTVLVDWLIMSGILMSHFAEVPLHTVTPWVLEQLVHDLLAKEVGGDL